MLFPVPASLRGGSRDPFRVPAAPGALWGLSVPGAGLSPAAPTGGSALFLPIASVHFAQFPCPIGFNRKGRDLLGCEAAVAPPLSPSRGSTRVGWVLMGLGVVFPLEAGEGRKKWPSKAVPLLGVVAAP